MRKIMASRLSMVCTSCSFELLQRSSSFFIGSIVFKDKEGVTVTRKNAIAAKTVATTLLADGLLTAGADGAVFLYVQLLKDHPQGPYSDMSQVTIKNEFPRAEGVPANVRAMEFSFTRVDRLGWPNSDGKLYLFVRKDIGVYSGLLFQHSRTSSSTT